MLIAEDDMVGRNMMKLFLEKHATCEMAVDGLEALTLFAESIHRKEPYDLIFLDIMIGCEPGSSKSRISCEHGFKWTFKCTARLRNDGFIVFRAGAVYNRSHTARRLFRRRP